MLTIIAWLAAAVSFAMFVAYLAALFITMRKTVGIDKDLKSPDFSLMEKVWLWLLGLKTPLCSTFGTFFLFISTESADLKAFNWEAFISHDKAVMLGAFFWIVGLWSHFSGLKQVAAMTPVSGDGAK
jgi:hypothetical protein